MLAGESPANGQSFASSVQIDATVWTGELSERRQESPIILPRWQRSELARRPAKAIDEPTVLETTAPDLWSWQIFDTALPPKSGQPQPTSAPSTDDSDGESSLAVSVCWPDRLAPGRSTRTTTLTRRTRLRMRIAETVQRTTISLRPGSGSASKEKPLPSWAPAIQVGEVPYDPSLFSPNPDYTDLPYSPADEWG